MPTVRPVASLALCVLMLPGAAPAAADGSRFGANAGVDTGHGAGSSLHQGVFVRFGATNRFGIELELERIAPIEATRGDPATGFGAGVTYQLTRTQRDATPFVRAGLGLEPTTGGCTRPGHFRGDLGLGAELRLDRALFVGADLRFTRRWEDRTECGDVRPASFKRNPGDPWDDITLRLSLAIGF